MKTLMVTGVPIPTPVRQQLDPFFPCDGFSSNNMRLNSSHFGTFWRVIPSPPHQSRKQCYYDDFKDLQPLIRIYHEKS
jgi:hypothetical protein